MASPESGVVAAGHEITAKAAAEILADGGNAFDAVLAGLFASCIPEIVLASPGGGGHLLAYDARSNTPVLYDFFVETPHQRRPDSKTDFKSVLVDFGPATQEFHVGMGATATPGFIPGLYAVHNDLCHLPMKRLVAPAISAARNGVKMNAFHDYLFSVVDPILTPSAKRTLFSDATGKRLQEGETLYNVNYADTLEALAEEGERLFTEGEVGKAILETSRDLGGHLTQADLETYKVRKRTPLTAKFKGHEIFLNPAPAASGPLIAFGLALLEKLSPSAAPGAIDLARVMAATNEVRSTYAADLSRLTDDTVLADQLAKVQNHKPAPNGTTHISVIDKDGNAAAATISNGEGNGIELKNFGFMLNNMLGEEDLNPDGVGNWQPATRMSTMMAPTLIRAPDGTLTALGSGGSNRIRTAVLQVALNLIDRKMPLAEAVCAPRLHFEKCGTLSFEDQFDPETRADLMATFPNTHPWPEPNMFFGGAHTVQRTATGRLLGAGDPRRAGTAIVVQG